MRAHLRQIENGIAGGQMDKDESIATDFGQWGNYYPSCWSLKPFTEATAPGALKPGEGLGLGRSITSADQRFTLVFQADGNLVRYSFVPRSGRRARATRQAT